MKFFFIIMVLTLVFYACVMDSVYSCKIKNNSTDKIQIKLSFDKNYIDSIYNGDENKFLSFVRKGIGQDSGVLMTNFDTLNLTVTYEALPKTLFTLENGMSAPNYSDYKTITIFYQKMIALHNKKEIEKAFTKIDGNYLMIIE